MVKTFVELEYYPTKFVFRMKPNSLEADATIIHLARFQLC